MPPTDTTAVAKPFEVRCQKIRNEGDPADAPKSVDVYLYGVIGDNLWGEGVTAGDFVAAMQPHADAQVIRLHINSPGGSVFDGHAIYEFLRSHAARVEAVVDGMALSAASVVAMAADHITMAAGAMMMIHRTWSMAIGNADEMRAEADVCEKLDGVIGGLYAARTAHTPDEIAAMMNAETWLNADDAVAAGFADAKGEAKRAAALAGRPSDRLRMRLAKAPEALAALLAPPAPANPSDPTDRTDPTDPPAPVPAAAAAPPAPADPGSAALTASRAELKRFMAAFGEAPGARWYTEGLSFEAAQGHALEAVNLENVGLREQNAAMVKRLEAAKAASGIAPGDAPSFQEAAEEPSALADELARLVTAFDGDVVRAQRVLEARRNRKSK